MSRYPHRGLPVAHRFGVSFLFPNGSAVGPPDLRFQKVSGIGMRLETIPVNAGGENSRQLRLPTRIAYDNLVLERGASIRPTKLDDIQDTMSKLALRPCRVQVSLYEEQGNPMAVWVLENAYPVRWALGELDGASDRILIETLELAYSRMEMMGI